LKNGTLAMVNGAGLVRRAGFVFAAQSAQMEKMPESGAAE